MLTRYLVGTTDVQKVSSILVQLYGKRRHVCGNFAVFDRLSYKPISIKLLFYTCMKEYSLYWSYSYIIRILIMKLWPQVVLKNLVWFGWGRLSHLFAVAGCEFILVILMFKLKYWLLTLPFKNLFVYYYHLSNSTITLQFIRFSLCGGGPQSRALLGLASGLGFHMHMFTNNFIDTFSLIW